MNPRAHSNASLALKPASCEHACDSAPLLDACQRLALTGDAIDPGQRYYAGERFLDHITFLGCAPHIQFTEQSDGSRFTHIIIHQCEQPVLFHGCHSRPPHCPRCNKASPVWRQHMENPHWPCHHCGQVSAATSWHWRKTAGYARSLIEITEVYPKEALPQPALLAALQQHTGLAWDYFYF